MRFIRPAIVRQRVVACPSLVPLLAALAACSGPSAPVVPVDSGPGGHPRTSVVSGAVTPASITHGDTKRYTVAVTPGTAYVVAAVGLSDSALVVTVQNGATSHGALSSGVPKDVRVTAAGSTLDIDVAGTAMTKPSATYGLLVMPAPVANGAIVGTEGLIPLRTPTVGWTEPRGRSRYRAEGATGPRTVSVIGLTGAAELKMFPDATYTMEYDCTLRNTASRECVVPAGTAYFEVVPAGGNRDGAGYVILVW